MNISTSYGKISAFADCIDVSNKHADYKPDDPFGVAKIVLTNLKMTCQAILNGQLTALDPIVGENTCQVRALAAITGYLNEELKAEAAALKPIVEERLLKLNDDLNAYRKQYRQFDYNPLARLSLTTQLAQLGISIEITERMDYLARSHLLTIGKYFSMNLHGRELSGISCETMKGRLKASTMNLQFLEALVHHSREKMSRQTIVFLQDEAKKLRRAPGGDLAVLKRQLEDRCIRVIKPGSFTFLTSCAFYNLKTVLGRVCEMGVPILLKEHGVKLRKPMGFYFRSQNAGDPPTLLPDNPAQGQPILVIEGFFAAKESKEMLMKFLQKSNLVELILANVALTKQYSADDNTSVLDSEAREEIARFQELGKALGCQTSQPQVFSIAHIHAATAGEEKVSN